MNDQRKINQYRYKIPTWGTPYLINGDYSGLTIEDFEAIDDFELVALARHGAGHWSIVSEESYFSNSNDVTDLSCNVFDCIYTIVKEEQEEEKLVVYTWLPVFPGFYGTLFDGDSIYENEIEYIEENIKSEELAACMIENLYISEAGYKLWEEYKQSTARQCVNILWNNLRNLHYVEEIEIEKVCSPKFYNFSNDSINVKVTFSAENIRNIKNFIQENQEAWEKYLKETYTSCDGFISHHSNNSESDEWVVEATAALADEHNAGAILQFICNEHNIDAETLYYGCETNVQLDTAMLKKECIKKGWYTPKNICLDWFRTLKPRFKNNYKFKKIVSPGFTRQYILETPKQRYIFAISKEDTHNNLFIVKRFFKIFIFAKLRKEKKNENNNKL